MSEQRPFKTITTDKIQEFNDKLEVLVDDYCDGTWDGGYEIARLLDLYAEKIRDSVGDDMSFH